jgi:hypothetical protein
MLELLFSPKDCVIQENPIFTKIVAERDKFLSKACRWSFGGYAIDQIKKAKGLDKKMNWEDERKVRKTPLDFCYIITFLGARPLNEWLAMQKGNAGRQQFYGVCAIDHCRDLYHIYESNGDLGYHGIVSTKGGVKCTELVDTEIISNDLCLSSIPKEEMLKSHVMYYNKDGYTKHCKDYRQYTEWLEKRNTQRYVDVEDHGQRIDGKNLLHCFRLLETGIEIATTGKVSVRRPNAEFLISIRKGKLDLNTLLEQAEDKIKELEESYIKSTLQDKVDRGYFKKLEIEIRKEYYGK